MRSSHLVFGYLAKRCVDSFHPSYLMYFFGMIPLVDTDMYESNNGSEISQWKGGSKERLG